MRRVWAPLAGMAAGIGYWASASALGLGFGDGPDDVVRLAMVPPLWQLVLAAAAGAALAAAAFQGRFRAAVWPLFALLLLAVPFLPWLADQWPAVRAVAGPARWALWGIVGWLILTHVASITSRRRLVATPALIFVASAAIYGGVAWRLTTGEIFPYGDEPHYLVMTQSLLTDGDLRIEDNHARGDYREYFPHELEPHYLTRGTDGEIYSVHPVGLPVLALPAFWLAGYPGVVAMLVLMAALAATLLWSWAKQVTGSTDAATFGWAAAAVTSPFLFNSFTVFPEVPAALAVMIALAWRPDAATTGVLVVRGLAVAALPWLSTKYAPMAALIGLVVMWRSVRSMRAALALGLPCGVGLGGWFLFFYAYWGTFSPSAPYGSQQNMAIGNLVRGFPGLLFDQEYGVMALAPVLVLALAGLVMMFRQPGGTARRAVEVVAVLGALLATVGAFHIWWGGSASPGRPVTSGVLLLGLPVAWCFARVRAGEIAAVRAGCHALLATSLAIAVILVTVRQGALLNNGRDGSALLLEWLSPLWPVWPAFPSYIADSLAGALGKTTLWLGLMAAIGAGLRTARRMDFGKAGLLTLSASGTAGAAIVSMLATTPPSLEDRARIPFLDTFDAGRRPVGVVYDPLSRTTPTELFSHLAFVGEGEPDEQSAGSPLLWDTRLALPAGTYRVRITREVDTPDVLGLQVGRGGDIHRRWMVAGETIDQTFVVPVDVVYAGFRASESFGAGSLRVTPVTVVDHSRRPAAPDVQRVVTYGEIDVFLHDARLGGDPGGFWTPGGRPTHVTFSTGSAGPEELGVVVRCGPIANQVTLSTAGWQQTLAIDAGASVRVSIPMPVDPDLGRRVASVAIDTRETYTPAAMDPASRDTRPLGSWFEMPARRRDANDA